MKPEANTPPVSGAFPLVIPGRESVGAQSVFSTNTMNTFQPPRSDTESQFDSNVFTSPLHAQESERKVVTLDFDSADNHKGGNKFILLALAIFLVLGAGIGGVAFVLITGNSQEGDFCLDLGQDDATIRTLLAENFIENDSEGLVSDIIEVNCLPESSFSALNITQLQALENTVKELTIRNIPLVLVHPRAFRGVSFVNVQQLNLINSGLQTLPDGVFEPFTSISDLHLEGHPFPSLNNNIFGSTETLETVIIAEMFNLDRFPGFISSHSNLQSLVMGAPPLVLARSDAVIFENLLNLNNLDVTDSPISSISRSDIGDFLGLSETIIVGAAPDFCDSFGISDQRARKILSDNFDLASIVQANRLQYSDQELTCLPKNAFASLTEDQLNQIENELTAGLNVFSPLQAINEEAFAQNIFGNMRDVIFVDNQLTALPDNVFEPFRSMGFLALSGNLFTTLNNNILGDNAGSLTFVALNFMPNLVEFPEFLAFAPNLEVLECNGCSSLETLNSEAFVGLENLIRVEIQNTPLSDLSAEEIRQGLNLDPEVTIQGVST